MRPTRGQRRDNACQSEFGDPSIWSCFGWGLPSQPVTRLLVSSYLTVSPLPWIANKFAAKAVCSLLHLPSGCPAWSLTSILPCEVRTFLPRSSCEVRQRQPAFPNLRLQAGARLWGKGRPVNSGLPSNRVLRSMRGWHPSHRRPQDRLRLRCYAGPWRIWYNGKLGSFLLPRHHHSRWPGAGHRIGPPDLRGCRPRAPSKDRKGNDCGSFFAVEEPPVRRRRR